MLTETQEVYTWGNGGAGRLGHGDHAPSFVPRPIEALIGRRVCSISSVWDHTLALTDGGVAYSWGLNYEV